MSVSFKGKNVIKCKHSGAKFPFTFDKQYSTHTVNFATHNAIDPDVMHSRFGHCSPISGMYVMVQLCSL